MKNENNNEGLISRVKQAGSVAYNPKDFTIEDFDVKLTINGQEVFFDYEQSKREELFLNYRELLLKLTGIGATKSDITSANKYIADNYPEYKDFTKP